ncbi:Catenin-beta-like protein [Flagelloscypha sp. PMI_526]|nr:Catenin-beta-like protein [Flagelloscypha sp. PMI_526]
MDIDSLFKASKLPTGGNKRKMPPPSAEALKRMRFNEDTPPSPPPPSDPSPSTSNGTRTVTLEEVPDEEDPDTDFAPGNDADYFIEEDEEGRFFGGGLTTEQKDILSIFEKSQGEGVQDDPDELNITAVRRILLRFQRAVNKNQDQRSKHPDDPTKFIDSEADLDSSIKSLLPLAQVPSIAYPELVKGGSLELLIGLLTHENADIVIDVVELIHELTDEDVGNEGEDGDEEDAEEFLKLLIEALVDNSVLELLVDNLARLNEEEESDKQGVFHVLGVFENVLSFNPTIATAFVAKTTILSWCLKRIQPKAHDENRSYAAELLSILLQDNNANRLAFGKQDGVEICLQVVSQFRKKDPVDADETEFMENVFDALCSALVEPSNKALFLTAEGPDLMILMMKEKLQSRGRSIKALDYSMSGIGGTKNCESFVEALGLKSLFSVFMGKVSKKEQKKRDAGLAAPASEDTTHALGIISSLLSNLASESPARIRLLAKFVESEYEKVDKLLDIRDSARSRLKAVEREIEQEKKEMVGGELDEGDEERWYLRRLDGGLFTLQTVDYILAWIAMEDDGVRGHIVKMLARKDLSMKDITATLRIFYENVDDAGAGGTREEEDGPTQKEILGGLIAAFEATDGNAMDTTQ